MNHKLLAAAGPAPNLDISTRRTALLAATLLLAATFVGIASFKASNDQRNDDSLHATNPRCQNIELAETGRGVHLSSGKIRFDNKTVSASAKTLSIPPSESLQVKSEDFRLFSANNEHLYFTRVPTACLAGGTVNGGPVGFLIDPSSLEIRDEKGKLLTADEDYRVDLRNDSIERLKGSSVAEGAVVKLDYKVLRSRIDTVSVDKDGNYKLTTGTLSQFAPYPAQVPATEIPIAHIHASAGSGAINHSSIMPISGAIRRHTSVEAICADAMNLSATRAKLARHEKIKLMMCGDSVCCGAFTTDVNHSYPLLFRDTLEAKTGSTVELTKIAAGGRTSSALFDSIMTGLNKKHPDLLVLEFVNDLSLPTEQIQKNYDQIFALAKSVGTEVIVCLPHTPSPLFYGQPWQDIANKPFYHVVPPLALKHHCSVADIAYRWLNIGEEGLQPIDLLADQANHPNNYGHQIYADELLRTLLSNI